MADVVTLPSNVIPYEIDIDIYRKTVMTSSYSKQYDTGIRYIVATLYNNGSPYPLTTTHTIYFAGTKNNADGILNELKGTDGDGIDNEGRIIYKLKETDTNTTNSYEVEFRFVDVSINSQNMASTPKFKLLIEKSALQDTTPIVVDSGSAMLSIKTAIDTVDQIKTDYETATHENTDIAITNLRHDMLYVEDVEETYDIPLDAELLDGHDSTYFAVKSEVNSQLAQTSNSIAINSSNIASHATQIAALKSGAPKAAFLASEMTDITKNYVYQGSEGGYIKGNLYCYYGTSWVDCGIYQAPKIATNSVQSSMLNSDISDKTCAYNNVDYTVTKGYLCNYLTGAVTENTYWKYLKTSCKPRDKFKCTTTTGTSTSMAVFYDIDNNYVGYLNKNTSNTMYTDYEFIIPDNAYHVVICGLKDESIGISRFETLDIKSKINNIEKSLFDYQKVDYDILLGYYQTSDGSFISNVNYKCLKTSCKPGDKLRCRTTTRGSASAMAIFYSSENTILSLINSGINGISTTYTDFEFTVPDNAYYVAIDGYINTDIKLEKYSIINTVNMLKDAVKTFWSGKKIVWFGTSIPAGVVNAGESGGNGAYPTRIGEMLGAIVYNESLGSSSCRAGYWANITSEDPLGWTGRAWENIGYALTGTLAEKEELINNWDKWKTLLTNNPPTVLTDSQKEAFRNASYERKLGANHLGNNRADLYVFDHGHNDCFGGLDNITEMTTVPPEFTDRTYFIGAMTFLIKTILADNPKARICFIGHYESDRKTAIYNGQLKVQELWKFPLFKTWEHIGWSQRSVLVNGVNKSLTSIWMPDDLHPSSDTTGEALTHYANVLFPFFRDVR